MNETPTYYGILVTIKGESILMGDWDMTTNPIQTPKAGKEENEPKDTETLN